MDAQMDLTDAVLFRLATMAAPPLLFLFLRGLDRAHSVETWRFAAALTIVLVWCAVVGLRTAFARLRRIHGLYVKASLIGLIEHGAIIGIAIQSLDGGFALYGCIVASILYWMIAGAVVVRYPFGIPPEDHFLVNHGYAILTFMTLLSFYTCVGIRGY